MILTEKHIITTSHAHYAEIDHICFLSKNLYNRANYIIRQEFITTSGQKEAGQIATARWMRYNELQKVLQNSKDADYEMLPRKISQQVLKQLDRNWKSFFAAIKEWKRYPSKFLGRPKLPNYKHKQHGRNMLAYTIQAISKPAIKNHVLNLSGTKISIPLQHNENIRQARIIPLPNKKYKIEIVYIKKEEHKNLDPLLIGGIDLGVNNLAAVTSNHNGWVPLLVNGRPVKSINQYFNKRKSAMLSDLMRSDPNRRLSRGIMDLTFKRTCKIDDYLHKASRFIIDRLTDFGIGTLVIGLNPEWKQEVNMGRKNNQSFVHIPFKRFIDMLKYKGELTGMKVIVREEAHTSKCSFIDEEAVGHQSKYAGRRMKRGLFKSKDGVFINADCNGSGNIIRKEIPNAFANGIEGVVVRPLKITIPISGKPIIEDCNIYKKVA